jgi:putative sterol carrier protein
MIDTELKAMVHEKIEGGEFSPADIPEYLQLLSQIGSDTADVQDEVAGWDRKIQFRLEGSQDAWIEVAGGRFTEGPGVLEKPDLVLTISAPAAAQLFSGQKDAKAAYMSGILKIDGRIPDALKLQNILTIVNEEIEY